MGLSPRLTQSSLDAARHRVTTRGNEKDSAIMLDSTMTDSGNTPTFRIRAGNVVGLESGGTVYHEANDVANIEVGTAPSVTSLEAPDVDWQNDVITFSINGQTVVAVTLGAGDDTVAEVVIALNADAIFAANMIADDHLINGPGADVLLGIRSLKQRVQLEHQVRATRKIPPRLLHVGQA